MRVLHVAQPVEGGVARVLGDLTHAQLAAGMEVSVACPPGGPLAVALADLGCAVLPWQATRSPGPSLVGEVRRLAAVVSATRPDVIHAHSAKAGLAARLAVRNRVPTVFQPHAWSFEAVDGAAARLALGWERFAARWTARVICVSAAERETGRRAGINARWTVIPNGVDLERFRPATRPGPGAADSAETGAGPLVVCVGRLCRQKGQDVLLAAWPAVLRELPGARLALVGDGPDAPRLREGAPDSVRFAGAVDDPLGWYQAADLVVLPSRWEGMALAPLEAMACGRPVLVTDVDGARESVPPSLAPHCLVPPDDPDALARALVELLRDPRRRSALGDQAHLHARARHDIRRTTAAVADVYRELAGVEPPEHKESIAP
ncbi:glycosyltransferase [Streptomyces apocyni]|uniref:glycosyltransferase n=1 Tax=Streptomyces apocyni TaxID=2654677 RepID=UPI0012E9A05C|nr:glycosyltransferase [Streptomyces apocyni]